MDTMPQITLSKVEVYGALRYSIDKMALIFDVTPAYIADLMADKESDFSQAYDIGRAKANDSDFETIKQLERNITIDTLKSELFGL